MKRIIICLTLALLYASTHISANACNQHNQSTHKLSEEDKAFIKQVEENAKYAKEAARRAAINAASAATDAAFATTASHCASSNTSQTKSSETITPNCEHIESETFVLTEEDKAFLKQVEENNNMMTEVGGKQAAKLAARLAAEAQAEVSSECNITESSTK